MLAACTSAPNGESAIPARAERTEPDGDEQLDAALHEADLALTRHDDAPGGGVYRGIRQAGRGVGIDTALAPTARSVHRAVELCATAASVVDGYRVAVHARNGRLLAFRVNGPCRRVHMKATTTLWSLPGMRAGGNQ